MPQRLLSDNGVALNPSRRGYLGQLVAHVSRLGVEAITGKPYKPTTQGKNERFHQTLLRYLDKQPLADTLAKVTYLVGGQYGLQKVTVEVDGDTISVIDAECEIVIEHTRPAAGITYVGNGQPRGRRPNTTETSPKS